jgi:hypothetical protein
MYRCNGACGKEDCAFVTHRPSNLKIHADPVTRANHNKRQRELVKCPKCEKMFSRDHMSRHMVRKHKKRRRKRRVTNVIVFAFLRRLVRTCIYNDKKAGRGGDVDVHAMAEKIYTRASGRTVDDNGGNITGACAMVFQPYSLFSLTLDRIDDALPHFVNNSLDNICITIRGMNVWCSLPKAKHTCCAMLRAEVERNVTEAEVEEALAREKKSISTPLARRYGQKPRNNILYTSVKSAYKADPLARAAFGTVKAMFTACYALFAEARARCAISSICLSGHAYIREKNAKGRSIPHPFQPSVDAINPTLGHVPGNLRIVCRLLNPIDKSKGDVHRAKRSNMDAPQQWTPELWRHYVGL